MSPSSTITDDSEQWVHNPHAGEMLRLEFLESMDISQEALAEAIGAFIGDIGAVVDGTSAVSADLDLRLTRYFGLSEGSFLRLQNAYELMESRRRLGPALDAIRPRAA